jgi:tetratricopeptide (TPR) repeat protein
LTEALWRLGTVQAEMGETDTAILSFGRAIDSDRTSAEAFCQRGTVFLNAGFADLAYDDFSEAIRLKPGYAVALAERAKAALARHNVMQAVEDARAAIRLDPQQAQTYRTLAAAYVASWPVEVGPAVACFQEAARRAPDTAAAISLDAGKLWFERAARLHKEGMEDDAQAVLAQAKLLDPQYAARYEALLSGAGADPADPRQRTTAKVVLPNDKTLAGHKCLQERQYDRAVQLLTDALAADPLDLDAYYDRGCAFLEKNSLATALADFQALLRIERSTREAHSQLPREDLRAAVYTQRARAQAQAGDAFQAIDEATQAIRLQPKQAAPYRYRAWAYVKDGQFDRALADLSEAVRLDASLATVLKPLTAEAYAGRGQIAVRNNHPKQAVDDFHKALELDSSWKRPLQPLLIKALRNYADERSQGGETAQAVANLTEAIQLDNRDAESYLARGLLYAKQRQAARAKKDLEQARLLDSRWNTVINRAIYSIDTQRRPTNPSPKDRPPNKA